MGKLTISRTASTWCAHGVGSAAQHSSGQAALYSIKEGWVASIHPPSAVFHRPVPEVS
jgi:hypothetical protein